MAHLTDLQTARIRVVTVSFISTSVITNLAKEMVCGAVFAEV